MPDYLLNAAKFAASFERYKYSSEKRANLFNSHSEHERPTYSFTFPSPFFGLANGITFPPW